MAVSRIQVTTSPANANRVSVTTGANGQTIVQTNAAVADAIARADIAAEIGARVAGDAALSTALGVETTARIAGDATPRYTTVQDEGISLTQRSTINFTGGGVSVADTGGKTVVSITGAGAAPLPSGIDDTLALQAWIDSLASGSVGLMPGGDYIVNEALTFPVDQVTIDMNGSSIRGGSAPVGQLAAKGAYFYINGRSKIVIKNGRILPPVPDFAQSEFFAARIYLNQSNGCLVSRMYTQENLTPTDGFYLDYGIGGVSEDNEISDCYLLRSSAGVLSSTRGRILRNIFIDSPSNATGGTGYNTEPADHLLIQDNVIIGMGRIGIEVYSPDGPAWVPNPRIINNHIEATVVTGYQLTSIMGRTSTIRDNTLIHNAAGWCIECAGFGTRVLDNHMTNTARIAGSIGVVMITADASPNETGGIISGNTIHNIDAPIQVISGGFPTPEPTIVTGNSITDPYGTAISVVNGAVVSNNSIRFGQDGQVAGNLQAIACNAGCNITGNHIKLTMPMVAIANVIILRLEGDDIVVADNYIDCGTMTANLFVAFSSAAYTGWSVSGNRVVNPSQAFGGQDKAGATIDPFGKIYSFKGQFGPIALAAVGNNPTIGATSLSNTDSTLVLQRKSGQTAPMLQVIGEGPFPTASGVVIDSNMNVGLGGDATAELSKLYVTVSSDGSTLSANSPLIARQVLSTTGGTTTDYAVGLGGQLVLVPSVSQTLSQGTNGYKAIGSLVRMLGAGTVDSVANLETDLEVYSGFIGDYHGLRLTSPFDGSGATATITNTFGIRIQNQGFGASASWGIFQEASTDRNYFAGSIGLGQPNPTAYLHFAESTLPGGGILFHDTNLYRLNTGIIKTDSSLAAGVSVYVDYGGTGAKLLFGAAADTNLYRNAASALKTDGAMIIGTTLKVGTQPTYTVSNVSTDRSYDANATTIDELADTLGTLIADLRTIGLVL